MPQVANKIQTGPEQAGYDDAVFDGFWDFESLDCQCDDCHAQYTKGFEAGMAELTAKHVYQPELFPAPKTKQV